MKKSIIVVLSLFFAVSALFAQNIPPSFQAENAFIPQPQVYNAALQQNISMLRAESMEDERNGQPMRIAIGITADLQLINENVPVVRLAGGEQIRRQAVYSAGAYGLILTFGELFIPEGGILFVYTENREQIEVFTHETNPSGGMFATGILYQNKIVLEYVESTISDELPRIHIIDVAFMYRSQIELRNDLSCFVNANCSEGDDWYAQRQGVVGTRVNLPTGAGGGQRGWFICSGSLINNVREDGRPFILTAYHCIQRWDETSMSTMQFDFFKESELASASCLDMSTTSSHTRTRIGAWHRATVPLVGGSDGSLLELRTPIPEDWPVFFNGWDITAAPATSGVSIHHPAGMVKKISTFTTPLVSTGNVYISGHGQTAPASLWRVIWAATENGHSVVAGGSSGSPIFNQNGHIVGAAVAASSSCANRNNPDFYGKLSFHWREMGRFLDPDDTGTLILDGFNRSSVDLPPPVAVAATNITYNSFRANWEAVVNATRYYLDVFYFDNSTRVYVDGFQRRNVRNVTSFEITGLKSDTEYFYVVRAGASIDSESPPSNQISVTTLIPGFTDLIVTATEATNITDVSFRANWEELSDAIGYYLNVYYLIPRIGRPPDTIYISGFQRRDVGNVLSYKVEGLGEVVKERINNVLDNNPRDFRFSVVASDGINFSRISNEITFTILEYYNPGNGNGEITEIQVFVDSGNIIIYTPSAEDLRIFSILGQRVLTRAISKGRTEVPIANFSQGVYIVVIGSDARKIVVR